MRPKFKRIILIVLDGCGVGVQEDHKEFHSKKTNTIGNLYKANPDFQLSFLESIGLKDILSLNHKVSINQHAMFCKLKQTTPGNDTFAGMWEMFGVNFKKRFVSNGSGLGRELLEILKKNNLGTICNRFISGYKALDKYYIRHKETCLPILYVSNDGVLLLAAHDEVMSPDILNEYAQKISAFLFDKGFVRIITRPFTGKLGSFVRIEKFRKDFMLVKLPRINLLSEMRKSDVNIRITRHLNRIFNNPLGADILNEFYSDNNELIKLIDEDLLKKEFNLLIYVLPDTDNFGHKKDILGFQASLQKTDKWLKETAENLSKDDLLIITADHGCDPTVKLRGHCREFVPLMLYSPVISRYKVLGDNHTFVDIGRTIFNNFKIPFKKGRNLLK